VLSDFINNIRLNNLVDSMQKILLGVSGGIDSMVMTELFRRSGFNISIAHCNFGLRGRESDHDEAFVRNYATGHNITFYSSRFDVPGYSRQKKLSIQMAARELRIEWFESLLKDNGLDYYATAHHLDDQVETFFINLLRGTGISGIRGMLHKQGHLIHPMLFIGRPEIMEFALANKIPFREDSSNLKKDYFRNKIRHELIPLVKKLIPDYRHILTGNIEHFRSVEILYRIQIDNLCKDAVHYEGSGTYVKIDRLMMLPEKATVLFEMIRPFGFNYTVAVDLVNHLRSQPGKQFYSQTHRIIKDREHLIIEPITDQTRDVFFIYEHDTFVDEPVSMRIKACSRGPGYMIPEDFAHAALDADLLHFPLVLRRWEKGDFFYPLGMKSKKLVSDFFIDQKLSISQKDDVWLLTSGGEIAWIIGLRIDDRFKITPETTRVIEFRQEN
jgi:tRNA(Ile)-lysidine synthase